MGGVMKRFRSANQPEARGTGLLCDEELEQEVECGDSENCTTCIIDGVEYAVSEVIEYVPCKKTW
jgi:hypothetical protein